MRHKPAQIEFNDPLAVEMRAEFLPVVNQDKNALFSFNIALPMLRRGELRGLIILEAKANNESYRPDEIEVLAYTAHQIGHDLDGLQIQYLKAEGAIQMKHYEMAELKILEQQKTIDHLQVAFRQISI